MNVFATVKQVSRVAIDIFFPRVCVICGQRIWENGACKNICKNGACKNICKNCASNIAWIEPSCVPNIINTRKAELHEHGFRKQLFMSGQTCFQYAGIGRQLILALKYNSCEFIARDIAFLIKENRDDIIQYIAHSTLVPVPLSYRKYLSRGYNQSGLIIRELAKYSDDVNVENLLYAKHHESQTMLSPRERLRNAKNSFFARNSKKNCNKRVIVVDDVLTTGATLAACCAALFDQGFVDVNVLTLSCN